MEQSTNIGLNADNFVRRGNYALEDRSFQKAEQFFEHALNLDADCAQAYLGSFLAQVQCSSLEEYIQVRLQETAPAVAEPQPMQKNMGHIEKMAEQYAVEPHLTAEVIRKMYRQDHYYDSCVPQRREQRKQEEALWNEQPLLSRAERLATGAFAQKLTQAKLDLFTALDQRIGDAENDDIAAQQTQLLAYEEYLHTIDRQVIQANDAALKGTYVPQKEKKVNPPRKTACKKNRFLSIAAVLTVALLFICLIVFVPKDVKEAKYNRAEKLLWAEDIQGAISLFRELGDYKDSAARIAECEALQVLNDRYAEAEELLATGDKRGALTIFRELANHKDAAARAEAVRLSMMQRNSISAGVNHTVCLKADGTVVAVGANDYGQCDISNWTDIVAISAGRDHTVGLKADGTVVAVGANDYGQCDVSGWSDIVAISAGDEYTVGLKADGTVVADGSTGYGRCSVSRWTDIVAISAGEYHTLGLKADGTVVAVGANNYGQCDISGWTDIVAISAGSQRTVGLKADGTVVAVGDNEDGQCDVSDWTDIVAISAWGSHTVGLKADGIVLAVGYNKFNQCDVSDWTNIVAISAGCVHTVGLKADGTVVAVGSNTSGQCDVSGWTDIWLPDEE